MALTANSLNYNTITPQLFANQPHQNELQTRKNALTQKIRTIENRLGSIPLTSIQIGKFEISPYADILKNSVLLPPWYFINHDEIPARLRLANLEDPRLNDDQFLNEMATWMETKVKEFGIPAENAAIDKDALKFVIRLMRDRDGFQKAKDFMLAHETAHLCHDLKSRATINYILSWLPLVSLILAITLSVVLLPYVSFSVAIGGGSAVFLTGALPAPLWNASQIPFWKQEEKKADIDGVKALQGEARGGIYFFDTLAQYQLKLKMDALSSIADRHEGNPPKYVVHGPEFSLWDPIGSVKNVIKWFKNGRRVMSIDDNGNNLADIIHPPITERIAYLNDLTPQSQRT